MPSRLFAFLQAELPFPVGPPNGRWTLRSGEESAVDRIVVLSGAEAPKSAPSGKGRPRAATRRRASAKLEEQPLATVPITIATVIDPCPLRTREQAQAWLAGLDVHSEARTAFAAINKLAQAHRIAAADPYSTPLRETAATALVAGYGEGEQVAYGRWLEARALELEARPSKRPRRAALASSERRIVALIAGREAPLICEELVLDARRHFDRGALAVAALLLERAYAAAAKELPGTGGGSGGGGRGGSGSGGRGGSGAGGGGAGASAGGGSTDLEKRLQELVELRSGVVQAAQDALRTAVEQRERDRVDEPRERDRLAEPRESGDLERSRPFEAPAQPAHEHARALQHALERLEAALRARSVALT